MTNYDIPEPKDRANKQASAATSSPFPFWNNYNQIMKASNSKIIPPYWSETRDLALRDFTLGNWAAISAVSAMQKKIMALDFKNVPFDAGDNQMIIQSEITQQTYKQHWPVVAEAFLMDLFSIDNGGFLLINGAGALSTELKPTQLPGSSFFTYPLGFENLDGLRCQRTGNRTHPILYRRPLDDQIIKIHRTRLIFWSDSKSPNVKLNGVGYCTMSRAMDMLKLSRATVNLELESLGDRPMKQIWVALGWQQHYDDLMANAIDEQYARSNELGFESYARPPMIMVPDKEAQIPQAMEIKRFPEAYNRSETLNDVFYALAVAFNVDISEFWRNGSVGRSQASAEVEDKKAAGKLPAWFITQMTSQLNQWFAPAGTHFVHDFVDAQEDKLEAEIEGMRIDNVTKLAALGVPDEVLQQKLVEYEIVTPFQAEEAEESEDDDEDEPEDDDDEQEVEKGAYFYANDYMRIKRVDDDSIAKTWRNMNPDSEEQEVEKSLVGEEFEQRLEGLTADRVNGDIDEDEFNEALAALVTAAALAAWQEGSNQVNPTEEQQAEIDGVTTSMLTLGTLSAAITAALLLPDDERRRKLNFIFNDQIPLWTNEIEYINQIGRTNNLSTQFLRWDFTPGKDHCTDCKNNNGVVKTREEWQRGKLPRSRNLACKGYRCGCSLTAVTS